MNDGVAHIQAIVAQTEYIYLAAPVELPMSVGPVEPAVLKRKAQSPLTEHRSVTRPTSPHHRHLGTELTTNPGEGEEHLSPSSKPSLVCQASYHLGVGKSSERKWVKSTWVWSTRKKPQSL